MLLLSHWISCHEVAMVLLVDMLWQCCGVVCYLRAAVPEKTVSQSLTDCGGGSSSAEAAASAQQL